MPVPRRFDRRPPERDLTRTNERIRVPEVRLIGDDGQQVGVLKLEDALRYAQERDLDLVEVAPEARPPVCRVLDYSKYKYEQAQKQKQARKHQQQITVREIKFRPKIAQHDYDTKKGHVERFLRHKDKVKITIMFRGREVTHPERGRAILERLSEELAELATVEQHPAQDGRNMTMMLGPSKAVLAGRADEDVTGDDPPVGEGDVAETALERESPGPPESGAGPAGDQAPPPGAGEPSEAPAPAGPSTASTDGSSAASSPDEQAARSDAAAPESETEPAEAPAAPPARAKA